MSRDTRVVIATVVLAALCGLLQLVDAPAYLRYDRAAIAAGELWRLFTGQMIHLGPAHLLVNIAGLSLVALLVGRHLSLRAWAVALPVCALSTSLGLWWLSPDLRWYVGLSGLLHGLLVAGAVCAARRGPDRIFHASVVTILAAKLAWEQSAGAMPGTSRLAGGTVIVDAHLFGAIGGLAVAAALLLRHRS